MKQVVFHETGLPENVLRLEEIEKPTPKAGEALVRITARNINPSDMMFVQGLYGITPKLPSSAGFEASGVVEESATFPKGTRVLFTSVGTWKEYTCVPDAGLIPIPDGMTDEVACQAFVNPVTAYGMLETSGLQKGGSLLITAGASAWGKVVIQLAAMRGIHVIATVRQADQKQTLLDLGATAVIDVATESLTKKVKEIFPEGIDYVFDAVGGDQGAKALNCLKTGGKMLVFGLLSQEPIPLNSGLLIFKKLSVEGWWLSSWWEELGSVGIQKAIKAVFSLLLSQEVTVDIQATFPLAQFKEAIDAYQTQGRTGKILLV
ncbi:zinc-dependent alcohol dehydrogenase family protein [Aquirufa sp. HETE-83D]|uniref:Zinc-dependent alcohol dehydrogenase family protein n=1 Tax=Aquirufa esocilacus TaxID=3096513 RepID=A0ABW6DPF1_9BACT